MGLHRPHPLARAPLVDRLDRLLVAAWAKGLSSYPSLDPEVLMSKGSEGYSPFDLASVREAEGVADFEQRLSRLCDALEAEAQLSPLGRTIAHGQIVRIVEQRHALGKLWREKPEILETDVEPPIIIVGQMRSGTTRLHRLLAADPAHSSTRFCDSWNPAPRYPDTRPLSGMLALFAIRRLDPWIDAIHPMGSRIADEELGWMAEALDHSAFEVQWRIPSFVRWSEASDHTPIYRELERLLKTDAAHHRNADRPRAMKVPQFAEDLPALLAQFPDARLVVSQRDEEDVLRSSVSLVANQMTIQSDSANLDWIETEWRRKIALRRDRLSEAMQNHEGVIAEVDFERLSSDWHSEMSRAYRALGSTLSDQALAAMERVMTKSEGGAHTVHAAQLNQFEEA